MGIRLFFLLTVTSLILAPQAARAQKGLKVGGFFLPQYVSLLNADDSDLDDDLYTREFLSGMAVGANLGYNPVEVFGFRMNVIYSQQGGRFSADNSFFDRIRYTTRLEYLKVPLMMGFNSTSQNRKVMLSLYGGFQFGFLTRAWTYDDDTEYVPPIPPNITNYPDTYAIYKNINYSLVGDAGIDVKITPEVALNLHLRGDYSILDAEDKDVAYRLTENGFTQNVLFWDELRTATHNMTVGVLFGITYTFLKQ